MNVLKKLGSVILAVVVLTAFSLSSGVARAGNISVAVLNMQEVVLGSDAGIAGRKIMEKKARELRETFRADGEALAALQKEIQKKSSVWSEEKKQEKVLEFQKKRRDLQLKQADAKLEMKSLQDKQLAPILKELKPVVAEVAKKKGYTLILPKSSVVYAADSIDISEEVTKALNARMKKSINK
ncbi:outer membrane protein [bacterium BMS3Bbin14]|nr:outer membrane protein [bacterium BMS3Bbin14]